MIEAGRRSEAAGIVTGVAATTIGAMGELVAVNGLVAGRALLLGIKAE